MILCESEVYLFLVLVVPLGREMVQYGQVHAAVKKLVYGHHFLLTEFTAVKFSQPR